MESQNPFYFKWSRNFHTEDFQIVFFWVTFSQSVKVYYLAFRKSVARTLGSFCGTKFSGKAIHAYQNINILSIKHINITRVRRLGFTVIEHF